MSMPTFVLFIILAALTACNTKTNSEGASGQPVSGYSVAIAAAVLRQGNYDHAAELADAIVSANGLNARNQKFAEGIRAAAALHTAHYDRAAQALGVIAREEPTRDGAFIDAEISVHPNRPEGYFARAALSLAAGQYAAATADCDIAIELEVTGMRIGIRDRSAWESFDAGRFQEVIDNLGNNSGKAAAQPYTLLLLHLARAKLGRDDTQDLAHAVDSTGQTEWPAPVLAFYLGRIDQKQLFAAAGAGPNRKERKGQLCEANFYAGEAAGLHGQTSEARDLFDAAVDDCPPTFFEARAAGSERARLAK